MLRIHAAVSPVTGVVQDHLNQSILSPVPVLVALMTLEKATMSSIARHDQINERILGNGWNVEHAAGNEGIVLSSQDYRRYPDVVENMAGT